jgi:hypothetical protein
MAMIDLDNITPEQLEQLKALIGQAPGSRSPAWKPLKDMRAPTTQKGRLNRPHFEWSAEDDGQTVIKPYPRLYWDANGVEKRVESEAEFIPHDWTSYPPSKAAIVDPMVRAQQEFDALSPEDQQLVLAAQKQARLNRLQSMMSDLSDANLAQLMPKPVEGKKKP